MAASIINEDKLREAIALLKEVKIKNEFGEELPVKFFNVETLTPKQSATKGKTESSIGISKKSYPTVDLYTLKLTIVQ